MLHCKLFKLCLVHVSEKRDGVVDTKSFCFHFLQDYFENFHNETFFETHYDCFGIFFLQFYVSAEILLQRSQLSQNTSVVILYFYVVFYLQKSTFSSSIFEFHRSTKKLLSSFSSPVSDSTFFEEP